MWMLLVQVLMKMRNDEAYQQDVGDVEVMETILQDVKLHPDRLARCCLLPVTQYATSEVCQDQCNDCHVADAPAITIYARWIAACSQHDSMLV